jgi:hypothetical protein
MDDPGEIANQDDQQKRHTFATVGLRFVGFINRFYFCLLDSLQTNSNLLGQRSSWYCSIRLGLISPNPRAPFPRCEFFVKIWREGGLRNNFG